MPKEMFSAGAEELFMLASTVSSSFNRKIKDVKQVKSLSRLPLLQTGFLLVLADSNITSVWPLSMASWLFKNWFE